MVSPIDRTPSALWYLLHAYAAGRRAEAVPLLTRISTVPLSEGGLFYYPLWLSWLGERSLRMPILRAHGHAGLARLHGRLDRREAAEEHGRAAERLAAELGVRLLDR